MKELKDYLHLYLGCQVQFKNEVWKLKSVEIGINGNVCGKITRKQTDRKSWDLESYEFRNSEMPILPILRSVKDINEDDALGLYKIYDKDWENYLKRHTEQCPGETFSALEYIKSGRYINSIYSISTQPSQAFSFLLLKHFDLFNLIESGLAIELLPL